MKHLGEAQPGISRRSWRSSPLGPTDHSLSDGEGQDVVHAETRESGGWHGRGLPLLKHMLAERSESAKTLETCESGGWGGRE